jgi:two-component system, cell cycle sensor histidine kinase and response regulator CckA
MLRRVIGEHIELVIDAGAPRGFIQADPAQLGQVVMNLALNSRDAMVHGGTLTLETKIVDIAGNSPLEDLKPGQYVVLAVKDTGIGMDMETQSHVFEPFFTTKAQGLGTGLGLSTVHGIIDQTGAHIRFSSELGYGTIFRIFFPCVAEPAHLP